VLERPDDDGPRLVYADALVEAGDPRGEYIHASIALERTEGRSRDRRPLRVHLRKFSEARAGWTAGLPAGVTASFRRGFIEELFGQAAVLLQALEILEDREPVRAIRASVGRFEAHELLLHPAVARLDEVVMVCRDHPRELVAMLPRMRPLPRLRGLGVTIERSHAPPRGLLAPALAASPLLEPIERLAIHDQLRAADVEALVASPHLDALRELDLGDSELGPSGLRVLAAAPRVAQLARLRIGEVLGRDDAEILAGSPHLRSGLELGVRFPTEGARPIRRVLERFRLVER
jgi:uncharacterized protein (TIGR02996 family)